MFPSAAITAVSVMFTDRIFFHGEFIPGGNRHSVLRDEAP